VSERSAAMAHVAHESRRVRLTIPAKPEYITLSRLALTEACSNSVRHAYGGGEGHVEICFELLDDRLVVEVADDGAGFEPNGAEPELEGDDLSEGGLGIAIIRSIADEVEIGDRENGRGARLRFVKLL
jgi:anti-sigma regulatory factor (Ser/Thr protein kinase)